jgi:hypothetical protein
VSTTEVIPNESDRERSAQELNFQGSCRMNLSTEPLSTRHFEGLRLALAAVKALKYLAREDFGDNPVADVHGLA